jgi:hypothetical protein
MQHHVRGRAQRIAYFWPARYAVASPTRALRPKLRMFSPSSRPIDVSCSGGLRRSIRIASEMKLMTNFAVESREREDWR